MDEEERVVEPVGCQRQQLSLDRAAEASDAEEVVLRSTGMRGVVVPCLTLFRKAASVAC